ncbi:MAG TPA: peroxiredoxin [Chloroflexota bacterium]|nr:peroxiredoxin [Chloroflexota bacterium]
MSNEKPTQPSVGQPAPTFSLAATGGRTISLADYHDKQALVLYFYPKDDTPGCTKEACAFRDLEGKFADVGAAILGVSTDPVDSHEAFARKFSLGFPLLADPDASVAHAYGAYGTKNLYGKISEGVLRTTFVIDRAGIVRKVYPNVKVDQHADEVLAFLGTL